MTLIVSDFVPSLMEAMPNTLALFHATVPEIRPSLEKVIRKAVQLTLM
jgi:hypothetical protein